MPRSLLAPAAAILLLASLPACRKPDPADSSGYGRYVFDLRISRDATAGFVCIASVTDQLGNGTLRTQPFRAMPGQPASGSSGDPRSDIRLEATITVAADGRRATFVGRLFQKGQRTVIFEATRDIPKE